jgi:hypothetical protein
MKTLTRTEFKMAVVNHCFEEGRSFDSWDLSARWEGYQEKPEDFEYLAQFIEEPEK